MSQRIRFDDAPRRLKVTAFSLAGALLLVAVTAGLTTHLTQRAVEDRLGAELAHTAALLGGSGFPLNDQALERVSDYVQADVVAVDGEGRILATNLAAEGRADFARARAAGAIPLVPGAPQVSEGHLAKAGVTVGVAPFEGGRGGVYVLYPEHLLAQQSREAWLPVTGVAVLAALLAVVLGVWSERVFQRSRNAALLRLLAVVGHEVRNPLGAIRTLAQSLKRRLGPETDPQPLDLIAAEAERLTYMVEGLRALGLPLRTLRREVDPEEAVDGVLALTGHQLAHRRVHVERERTLDVHVSADPAHVRQVVLNLLLNAADAMPRGGVLRVVARAEPERWVLAVEDEGPGVSPEVRERLFSAFVTSKAKGLGVGLFLSRRLVEANGGELELDEHHAGGARFVVSWPRTTRAAPTPEDACRES